MSACVDRRDHRCIRVVLVVHRRQAANRPVSGENRCGFGLWSGRIVGGRAALGLLFGPTLLPGSRVH